MSATSSYHTTYELEFEGPLLALERQITDIESSSGSVAHGSSSGSSSKSNGTDLSAEVGKLRQSHTQMLKKIYSNLDAWSTVQVARHPARPQTSDYTASFVKEFTEIHGDRCFGDDKAIVTGFGRIGPHKCMLIGHHKGKDTRDKVSCNFGCAHPEGYRKALRAMRLAEKFNLPVVTLIDTPGAYPGIGAEERGQAEAIAVNLREMSTLKVPIVSVVIGEGGSGGALGLGVADKMAMLEYAWYSVISPEGCAAILWKTANKKTNSAAAAALKLTADDNKKLGTVDQVIEEPLGGAHRNPEEAGDRLEKYLVQTIRELKRFKPDNLINKRYQRLRHIGEYDEQPI